MKAKSLLLINRQFLMIFLCGMIVLVIAEVAKVQKPTRQRTPSRKNFVINESTQNAVFSNDLIILNDLLLLLFSYSLIII